VGLVVNLHVLSRPAFARLVLEKEIVTSQRPVQFAAKNAAEDAEIIQQYWRGRVDEKLTSINDRLNQMSEKMEALDCSLTETKVAAAKEGGIYGSIAGVIVLLSSLLGRIVIKGRKNNG